MYRKTLALGHKCFLTVEDLLNRVFSPRFNPMYYLGAIAFLFTWLVFISGFYLLFVYRISVDHAYDSLENLNWFNRLFRSMHRYASDGAMVAIVLHLLREFFNDRFRGFRWIAWVTGVAVLAVYWVLGVTGYWMVWDQRSQLIARMSAEFLDFLPIFVEPITRAFLSNGSVSNILFIGVIFLHLSVPTIALFVLWLHLVRISRPVINPPRDLVMVFTALTVLLCIVYPATSVERADLGAVAARFGIDWLYLVFFPMLASVPIWVSWAITVAGTGILTILPWSMKPEGFAKAEVLLPDCVGCELCFKDCPYEAIYMRKRTDGLPYKEEAVVVENRCASCGLCVGACDYHAIDLPDRTEGMIYREIKKLMSFDSKGEPKILNVSCGYGVDMKGLTDPNTKALKDMPNARVLVLPCVAMLQPVMIEIAMKSGAEGVFISGCQTRDCHFREGDAWIEGKLLDTRPPVLRKKEVDIARVRAGWFSSVRSGEFLNEIKGFNNDLKEGKRDIKPSLHRYLRERLTSGGMVILLVPALMVLFLSDAPYTFFGDRDSLLRFSIKHGGQHIEKDRMPTEEELKGRPLHMRGMFPMAGRRFPVYIELELDGKRVLAKSYRPSGLKREGASYAHEKIVVTPGIHRVAVRMSNSNSNERFDYSYERDMEFEAGRQVSIDFNEAKKEFFIRD